MALFTPTNLSDDEDEACPTEVFTDINTIRIFLQWLPGYTEYQVLHQTTQMDLDEESDETRDEEPARRSVHERVAKDAHPGSAQLEKPERSTHRPHKSGNHLKKYYRFNRAKAAHIPPIEFVFHYGPKGEQFMCAVPSSFFLILIFCNNRILKGEGET